MLEFSQITFILKSMPYFIDNRRYLTRDLILTTKLLSGDERLVSPDFPTRLVMRGCGSRIVLQGLEEEFRLIFDLPLFVKKKTDFFVSFAFLHIVPSYGK